MGNSQEICFSAVHICQNVISPQFLGEGIKIFSSLSSTLQISLSVSISAIEDGAITKFTYTGQVALILQLTGKLKKIMYIDLKEGDELLI